MGRLIESEVETRRLSRFEYDKLVETGLFHGERIELLDGLLVVREPQLTPHTTAVRLVQIALERAFGAGWDVRSQLPFALDDESEPEPDVVVVPGAPRDYLAAHPSRCALIVEVADSSLVFDRRKKAPLYARAGIADYWIVNLRARTLEVYRRPTRRRGTTVGWVYAQTRVLRGSGSIAPLALPAVRIPVSDLLP